MSQETDVTKTYDKLIADLERKITNTSAKIKTLQEDLALLKSARHMHLEHTNQLID